MHRGRGRRRQLNVPAGPRVRVLRVIARLNVGGPAIQAITLTSRMRALGYDTTLVRGVEGPSEGSMDALAVAEGVDPVFVPSLRRALGPRDVLATLALVRIIRRERPAILHTHTAKAGTVGRVAAVLSLGRRPAIVVHTFHGHVLSGYFSPRATRVFTGIERALARVTTRLIAVSDEVRDDLVRLGVAPARHIVVIPLGFDLQRFARAGERRSAARAALGLADGPVVLLVARLVPIKRVDRFLRIAELVATPGTTFLVAGDGELREELLASPEARRLGDRVRWLGMRTDVDELLAAADVTVLCSDNEGTPVSLIESLAAAVPVVSTAVGGVPAVVGDHGVLVAADDEQGFAAGIDALLADGARRAALGRAGQADVLARFGLDRLVADVDALYVSLHRLQSPGA
jgi:glycosyltransferase involved in cell wall biosynthesis